MSSEPSRDVDLRHGELGVKPETSKLFRARRGSFSLKTTVPDWIVNCLDLEPGDTLCWTMIFRKEKPHTVLVHKEAK